MTETRQNFSLIAGDTTDVDYGIAPTPDPPFDIAQTQLSWTAYPQVRGVADKTMAAITKTLANGGIGIEDAATYAFVVHLATADTLELSGNYYYEIVIVNPLNNNHRSTPTIGTLTAINTGDPLNVVAFKSFFPQLAGIDDGVLQTAIDEASLYVDDSWGTDATVAIYYLAAHFASVGQAAAATGGQVVTSEHIGQISVSYAATSASSSTSGYPSLSTTPYGLMFLNLMGRNSGGVAIA